VLFDAARPVILNGIEESVTRPDLADRALFLTLEPIPEDRRRPEQELWGAFEKERPRIMGVLLRLAWASTWSRSTAIVVSAAPAAVTSGQHSIGWAVTPRDGNSI
jgi:hypothetical protein